jgi:hypothetical protein
MQRIVRKASYVAIATAGLMLVAIPVVGTKASPSSSQDIRFNGHCYGLHLDFSDADYTVGGWTTGCAGNQVWGVAKPGNGNYGVTDGAEYLLTDLASGDSAGFFVVKRDHTWTLYGGSDRGYMTVADSGTWSLGTPYPVPTAFHPRPSDTRHTSPLGIEGDRVIYDSWGCQWDMHIPSHLGTKGTMEGWSHGDCNDPGGPYGFIGSKATINGQRGSLVTVGYDIYWEVFYMRVFFPDHTFLWWDLYGGSQGGTWYEG